jgi:hypothetical protein
LAERLTEAHIPIRFITNGTGVLTGKGVDLPEGTGYLHLTNILEALAHLALEEPPREPFADTMDKAFALYRQEPEYWLISTYHGEDIEAAYNRLEAMAAKTTWIVPYSEQVYVDEGLKKRNKLILVE